MVKKFIITLFLICFAKSFVFAETIDINNDEIKKLIKNKVPIVDIRTSDEWEQTGIIPNSILLTFFKKMELIILKPGIRNLDTLLIQINLMF
jgi:rhodanese-related sulfurtransferase